MLNILGLSIAFAAAYIILVQVHFDLGYNRSFKDAERIYRLEFMSVMGNENKKMPHVSHYVGEAVGGNNANVEGSAWAFPYPQQKPLSDFATRRQQRIFSGGSPLFQYKMNIILLITDYRLPSRVSDNSRYPYGYQRFT